ncbi:hypothetical protein PR202_ga16437 [Eleusine coracana subsp. coracana]|uniref:Uncharacterized protein n=1 Tax=Eleusine coracana subsp. coracana TaxID=191504 RepID=A0AAV5CMU2_ELECO|nr:hypothetical protein PR202_ga16437 [Eleusine coracana subsp. coracana]
MAAERAPLLRLQHHPFLLRRRRVVVVLRSRNPRRRRRRRRDRRRQLPGLRQPGEEGLRAPAVPHLLQVPRVQLPHARQVHLGPRRQAPREAAAARRPRGLRRRHHGGRRRRRPVVLPRRHQAATRAPLRRHAHHLLGYIHDYIHTRINHHGISSW